MMSWLHNWIWIQQDYFWFLAGIGWLSVGIIWWQQRRTGEMPAWIPWSAAAGVVLACTQILIVITPVVQRVPNQLPSLRGDICIGLILAGQASGWWWAGLRRIRGGVVVACVIAALVLLAAIWRQSNPTEGSAIIFVVLGGAIVWWSATTKSEASPWRGAIMAAGFATLVDTTGPLATAYTGVQRWYDFSPLGSWSALAQCVAVVVVLFYWHRHRLNTKLDIGEENSRRWFLGGVGAWLAIGFLFAIAAGMRGRHDFENSALGRVRAMAAFMPMKSVEDLLGDDFQIGEAKWYELSNGGHLPIAFSEHGARFGAAVTADLRRIASVNPDVQTVTITTLRNDWLLDAAIGESNRTNFGAITLVRRAEAEDKNAWTDRNAATIGPVILSAGDAVFTRAPLVGNTGEMLGWLNFYFNVSQWLAAQAQPRSLAYLVMALGLIIGRQLIAQRIRARERDRARADAQSATEASRLKTTFLANVSHELRTPLQSIQGYTELILPNVTARDRERLLAVREHADLMARLVNDLIDLSAAESGKFHLIERPVVLMDIVVQAVETLRHRAETKDLALSVDVSPEIPGWLYADPQRIRQIVHNLVGNAIKYTDHGSVEVVLALVGRDRESAEIELRVGDTGPGIAAEAQPYLFEAFHRLEKTQEREGTGLGLAIVAAVSKAMRGSVRVSSDGRSGSTFTTRWRLRLAPNSATVPSSRVPLHGKKILIADDNALVRDLFVAYLTECGAVCATAGDGTDAVRRLRSEEFDAVVLDLAMPKLDGLSVVRTIRHERPDKLWRIVGVSAHAGGAEHDEALAAGMDVFLIKPVALPELARALSPSIGLTLPTRSFAPMRAQFAHRFRTDAPAQSATVSRAFASGRWSELHAAAHYLKNSADVVGDEELASACAGLEAAARAKDRKASDEAWRHCRMALARWLTEPAAN